MKISFDSNILKHILRNVYFINGTAYAGKSTMVRELAARFDGICCGENYHDVFTDAVDPVHQPNLGYFQTMSGWQEFISRTPEQYDAWITGTAKEAEQLELMQLIRLTAEGKKIFVDTNISPEVLHEISDYDHVAIMLAPQSTSVDRFFDRSDPEKQFLLRQIELAPDPEKAMRNYRACLEKINSQEKYDAFLNCGFYVCTRDDSRTIEQTMNILARHFKLI